MDKILEELKRNILEKGPQKHFYSNLSVTQPLQDSSVVNTSLLHGFEYLQKSWFSELSRIENSSSSSSSEIYTSLLALDILGDDLFSFLSSFQTNNGKTQDNCEQQKTTCSHFISTLHNFICPDCGLGSFNLFKVEDHMSEDVKKILPDDANTTALAVSILFRDGLLGQKPAENITRLLLNNSDGNGAILFFLQNVQDSSSGSESNEKFESESANNFVDLSTCANVLRLLYQMDMHYEAIELELFLYDKMHNWNLVLSDNANVHLTSDVFLFFLCRALNGAKEDTKTKFLPSIELAVDKSMSSLYELIENSEHVLSPIQTSLKILTTIQLSIMDSTLVHTSTPHRMRKLYEHLLCMQNKNNGSWPQDFTFFKVPTTYGNTDEGVPFGSKALTTIFAMKAIYSYYYDYNKRQRLNHMKNLSAIY